MHYFLRFESENGNYSEYDAAYNVKFNVAVLDTWENKIYFYEDYKENEWNPPRDENGHLLCGTAWTTVALMVIYFLQIVM